MPPGDQTDFSMDTQQDSERQPASLPTSPVGEEGWKRSRERNPGQTSRAPGSGVGGTEGSKWVPKWSTARGHPSFFPQNPLHRRQPTRLPCPRDSPGKNTGVGCHFLLQYMKVKSESEVSLVRLCATPWTAAHQAPPSMGLSRQEYWSGVPLPPPRLLLPFLN